MPQGKNEQQIDSIYTVSYTHLIVSVRLNNRIVPEKSISSTINFILMFVILVFVGASLVALSGFPVYDSLTAALSCIANVGPTFGQIGALGSYDVVPAFGKIILSILMSVSYTHLHHNGRSGFCQNPVAVQQLFGSAV